MAGCVPDRKFDAAAGRAGAHFPPLASVWARE
jgi:hypothetical protein